MDEKRKYNRSGEYQVIKNEVDFTCKICGKYFDSLKALEVHLRRVHSFTEIKQFQDYYNEYLKQPGDGVCINCGKPTEQLKFGYKKCCSPACARRYAVKIRDGVFGKYDNDFLTQIKHGLTVKITESDIYNEMLYYKREDGVLNKPPLKNRTVLKFQQDNFFKHEKSLFSTNVDIRTKLIENRMKYLNKRPEDLSDFELLRGFKISGLYRGYSHFNPLWTKWFCNEYAVQTVADPFGGWGHHLLGFHCANTYCYYNDLSHNTVEGVRRMAEYLHIDCSITEGDAKDFVIPDDCDAVFMCPPYYNIEEYECGKFTDRMEFDHIIYAVIDNWKNSNCEIMGVILRGDFEYLLDGLKVVRKEVVNEVVSHFNSETNKRKEYFYVIKKN